MKLLGDMYLLVGLYSDAIKCFDDGAERARLVGDVLWEAMAREGRAVAGVAEAWETRDGSVRSVCTPQGCSLTTLRNCTSLSRTPHPGRDPRPLFVRIILLVARPAALPADNSITIPAGSGRIPDAADGSGWPVSCVHRDRRGPTRVPLHRAVPPNQPIPPPHMDNRRMGQSRPVGAYDAYAASQLPSGAGRRSREGRA